MYVFSVGQFGATFSFANSQPVANLTNTGLLQGSVAYNPPILSGVATILSPPAGVQFATHFQVATPIWSENSWSAAYQSYAQSFFTWANTTFFINQALAANASGTTPAVLTTSFFPPQPMVPLPGGQMYMNLPYPVAGLNNAGASPGTLYVSTQPLCYFSMDTSHTRYRDKYIRHSCTIRTDQL